MPNFSLSGHFAHLQLGARANIRLGPHTMLQIKRGGFASTYAREEEEQHRKMTMSMDGQTAQTARLVTRKGEAAEDEKIGEL